MRSWLRTPRLFLALLACITVSIGGTATVLTFVHALLLRPLPFPAPDRLVQLVPQNLAASERDYLSYPNFSDLRSRATAFEKLEGATVSRLILQTPGGSERLRGETVTSGYFDLLGLRPALGRAFTAEEYAGNGPRAILLSSRLWRTRFGSNPGLVGQPVSTRDGPAVVVGIMPDTFLGIGEDAGTDYWLAEKQHNHPYMHRERAERTTLVFGRLKPNVSAAQADAELQSLLRPLIAAHPAENQKLTARVAPLAEKWRAPLRGGLVTMLIGSGFLLLIGCANVALLLLARLIDRERELALRLSLGASRRQLLALLLRESLVLAVIGGTLGVLAAAGLVPFFLRVAGSALPIQFPVALTAAPLALCATVVLATGLLFGVLPALAATRVNAALALRAGGRGLATRAIRHRSGRLLIIAQTALAVTLLSGAALFLRSYEKLRHADFGFRTASLLRYQVTLPRDGYRTPEALETVHRALAADFAALPGVQRFGRMAPTVPPYDALPTTLRAHGVEADAALSVRLRYTDAITLDILGVPLRAGRNFSADDRRTTAPVALISETLARRLAGSASAALNRHLVLADNTTVTVVGVLADALWEGRRDRNPAHLEVLLSLAQFPQHLISAGFLFSTSSPGSSSAALDPRALIEPVRRTVVAREPAAALHWIDTMEDALDAQTINERFWTVLATAYAATAFLLALVGLYGALSHSVATRRQELGVRVALGATAAHLARLVVGHGLRLVLTGVVAGLAIALALGRVLEARLFGITAHDPLALFASSTGLLAIALLACWLPARRAARTDPTEALRAE